MAILDSFICTRDVVYSTIFNRITSTQPTWTEMQLHLFLYYYFVWRYSLGWLNMMLLLDLLLVDY